MIQEFIPYEQALELKELGFDEPCFGYHLCKNSALGVYLEITTEWIDLLPYDSSSCKAPTLSQAINFLYICSNKQIDIELKASDTYEERVRKVVQGCEDLRNLQNSKSN